MTVAARCEAPSPTEASPPPHDSAARAPIRWARVAAIALVASLVGPFAETAHLRAGVWTPAGPTSVGWIAVLYGVGVAGACLGAHALERRFALPAPLTPRTAAAEATAAAALFVAPVALHHLEIPLAMALSSYLCVRLLRWRAPGDLLAVAAVVAADMAVESVLLSMSLYRYPSAGILPVPLWLAPLWGGLALGLRRLIGAAAGLVAIRRSAHGW